MLKVYGTKKKDGLMGILEKVAELIEDCDIDQIDMPIRTLINLLEHIENEEGMIKDFYPYVSPILSAILSAFTNEDITSHGRE